MDNVWIQGVWLPNHRRRCWIKRPWLTSEQHRDAWPFEGLRKSLEQDRCASHRFSRGEKLNMASPPQGFCEWEEWDDDNDLSRVGRRSSQVFNPYIMLYQPIYPANMKTITRNTVKCQCRASQVSRVATSKDGLHWTCVSERPVIKNINILHHV